MDIVSTVCKSIQFEACLSSSFVLRIIDCRGGKLPKNKNSMLSVAHPGPGSLRMICV